MGSGIVATRRLTNLNTTTSYHEATTPTPSPGPTRPPAPAPTPPTTTTTTTTTKVGKQQRTGSLLGVPVPVSFFKLTELRRMSRSNLVSERPSPNVGAYRTTNMPLFWGFLYSRQPCPKTSDFRPNSQAVWAFFLCIWVSSFVRIVEGLLLGSYIPGMRVKHRYREESVKTLEPKP